MSKAIDYYNSINGSMRNTENLVVDTAVRQGIVPDAVRYELHSGEIIGIIKSTKGDFYQFDFNDHTREMSVNAVDGRTAATMFEKCLYGFDLKKADDLEDEEKAVGGGGGEQGSGQPSAVTEEQAIAQQNRLLTEQHPGAATGITPDRPDRGRQWHQETVKSLKSIGEMINKSVEQYFPIVSDTEKQFLVEVLGRVPEEVDGGDTRMTPIQKVTYQKWLAKSVYKDYQSLNGWLAKRA